MTGCLPAEAGTQIGLLCAADGWLCPSTRYRAERRFEHALGVSGDIDTAGVHE
jgi:hypothetical protein